MNQFEQWFDQDLTQQITVRHRESIMFSADNDATVIGVRLYKDGEPATPGSSCTCTVIRSDGGSVSFAGSVSGNEVSAVIPQAALVIPGPIAVMLQTTDGTSTMTVLKAVFTCEPSTTGTIIDPGTIIPSVSDLIEDIEEAVESIPADYTELLAAIAPTFSSSTAYAAGAYVWYGGTLYRFTSAHAAGSWTGTDAAAVALASDVSDLKSAFEEYNVCQPIIERFTSVNWASGSGLSMTTGTWDIIKFAINPNERYWFAKPAPTIYANALRFATADNAYIDILSSFATLVTIPDTTAYIYFKCPIGSCPFGVAESNYAKYTAGYMRNLVGTYVADAANALTASGNNAATLSKMLDSSVNLANPAEFTKNKYMTDAGVVGNSTTYFYTGKIPVSAGDVLYFNSADIRYVTAFNGETVVALASVSPPLTIPSGVDGIVITGYMSRIDSLMISRNAEIPYMPYSDTIKNSYLNIVNKNSLNGNDGITMQAESVTANTSFEISEYPKIIAAHDRLSGYCEFSTLDEIYFGYGYSSNLYCGVDDTNINIYANGSLSSSTPHGITISDYLSFSIIMDDDRNGHITINSLGGTATTIMSLGYNKKGLPFIRSTTALTNVKLSAICTDIKNPIWWFGDSYSSLATERVIGQLDNYGVIGQMLIDAVPGGRTYYDASTGGYIEFIKLIKFAKPKYIIWALGMNDAEDVYKGYLLIIKNYCDANGITLYAAKIPSVPGIDNTSKNAYIDELGIRAIDWSIAVNATAQGTWYSGYLSSDNVHPTVKGAQAMAARTIVDCPAIMQF